MINKFLYVVVLFSIFSIKSFSKEIISTEYDLDAAYIYLLSKNTTWPNEKKLTSFKVAIVDENTKIYDAFKKLTKNLKLKSLHINTYLLSLDEVESFYNYYQVIFLSKRYKDQIDKIYNAIPKNYPILIISDGVEDYKKIMINLYKDKFDKKNIFINLQNVNLHQLDVSNEIILASGKEAGISKLFNSSLKALKEQEIKYKSYELQNKKLKQQISTYKSEIKNMKETTNRLKENIKKRENELLKKIKKISQKDKELKNIIKKLESEKTILYKKQQKLQKLQTELQTLKTNLKIKNKLIQEKKDDLIKQQNILDKKQKKINELDKQIKQQYKIIDKQKELVATKNDKLKEQNIILLLSILVAILLFILLIYIYKSKIKYEKLNQELSKEKERADNANKSKSIFLSSMSHELRTPLNAILGFSKLLLNDDSIPKAKKNTIQSIYKAGTFLLTLINDVLDISKIESGKVILHNNPNDVKALVEDAISLVQSRAREKGLIVVLDTSSTYPKCANFDGDKFRQILLNFITNAIKYSDYGEIKVKINFDKKAKKIYLEVKDEGFGIKEENLKDIFKPFIQVGKASQKTGTGLGLTITKMYAKALGGDVGVKSTYKKGSTFYAYIRYKNCSEKEILYQSNKNDKEVIGLSDDTKLKVLIIDNSNDKELLNAILSKPGFEIKNLTDTKEIFDDVKSFQPDIVWIDTSTNNFDIQKIIKKIKSINKDTKIFLISADIFDKNQIDIKKMDADDFILKPYDINTIFSIIKKHLHVKYKYKETKNKEDKNQSFTKEELISRLQLLSIDKLNELYNVVILLDKELICQKLKDVNDKELKEIVKYYLDNIQYEILISSLQEAIKKS